MLNEKLSPEELPEARQFEAFEEAHEGEALDTKPCGPPDVDGDTDPPSSWLMAEVGGLTPPSVPNFSSD